ncbi:MAG: cation:proton antiporter [Gemmatimonadaceae bacterium]
MDMIHQLFESELGYVVLLFGLFVVPRVLQRWRVPTAISAFALGVGAGAGLGLFEHDQTLHLLATFGIVGLFLFAGLEVDINDLRRGARIVFQHLAVRVVMLVVVALLLSMSLNLESRQTALLALALLIPSTGFILDSLGTLGLTAEEAYWVKTKAIATELLALAMLFVVMQSTSAARLTGATLMMIALIAVIPPIFRLFAVAVAPWAPKSEFAFLVMMAIVVAFATRQLGAYYLVGAFVVGVAAERLRSDLPAAASERLLHAVEVFASFFAPFYFFSAGAGLPRDVFSLLALGYGLLITAVTIPFRLASVLMQRRLALREPMRASLRIAVPLLPTLVFTLVIAGILRERFALSDTYVGALVVYAVLNTTVPGIYMRTPTPTYDAPTLPDVRAPSES